MREGIARRGARIVFGNETVTICALPPPVGGATSRRRGRVERAGNALTPNEGATLIVPMVRPDGRESYCRE